MNNELISMKAFGPYKALILILYCSIRNKGLKSHDGNGKLFRGDRLLKSEIDEIITNIDKKTMKTRKKFLLFFIIHIDFCPFQKITKQQNCSLE